MIERTVNIEVNMKDGSKVAISGAGAQTTLSQLETWKLGTSVANAFSYTDEATGNIITTSFKCICGFTRLPQTETEVPDVPCKQIDCL